MLQNNKIVECVWEKSVHRIKILCFNSMNIRDVLTDLIRIASTWYKLNGYSKCCETSSWLADFLSLVEIRVLSLLEISQSIFLSY